MMFWDVCLSSSDIWIAYGENGSCRYCVLLELEDKINCH